MYWHMKVKKCFFTVHSYFKITLLAKVCYQKLKQEHKVSYRCSLPLLLQEGFKDYKIFYRSSARFFDFGKKFLRNLRNFLISIQENSEAQNLSHLFFCWEFPEMNLRWTTLLPLTTGDGLSLWRCFFCSPMSKSQSLDYNFIPRARGNSIHKFQRAPLCKQQPRQHIDYFFWIRCNWLTFIIHLLHKCHQYIIPADSKSKNIPFSTSKDEQPEDRACSNWHQGQGRN